MDITAINRGATSVNAPAPAISLDKTSENREVIQAVKALNGTEMFGPENELRFQRDPASRRMVVRVVNRKTSEVVSQVPAEYILRLAEDLKSAPR
ncbi:MAG TPA: flagellar protein FlaG [Candidatus Acidoferrales bacterium]|nr:flagellar protein FlaG [Candidatus Acidoferrales bacterium]